MKRQTLLSAEKTSQMNMSDQHALNYLIAQCKEALKEHSGTNEYVMYSEDGMSQEIWEVLEEDIQDEQSNVRAVCHIVDHVATKSIATEEREKHQQFVIKPSILNTLFFYPNYNVGLVQAQVMHGFGDMIHHYILAHSDEDMQRFLDYVQSRKKEYIKNYVTVFTDMEHGVEPTKEKITSYVTRDDVIMEDKIKRQIFRSVDEFFTKNGSFFEQYNIPYKRGLLLYGKPGNGKTTLVKSIANSISSPVAYWQITEYTSSYSIQEVFSQVSRMAPMVLVIEDIDSLPESVRSVFLNTLDGATSKEGIFLIGTTNYPEQIDPALINRAGRFDRAYEMKGPTSPMRHEYLVKKKLGDLLSKEELSSVVDATDGFTFAQLNELYKNIALDWYYGEKVNVEELCQDLRAENARSKDGWMSEEGARLGFY
ncbi:ATP-binding protein [Alteribacter aurantiacus]|uniref:ATP-binding protein n=1 Tax=Alteribacter aurantiacus TaxID=254410 RepID=UPI000423E527|nr:ATP-binding protein [Alteribacter aurantiacus]